MKITLDLATDDSIALRRFAKETGEELAEAARIGLREFLIGIGALEIAEADNDNGD